MPSSDKTGEDTFTTATPATEATGRLEAGLAARVDGEVRFDAGARGAYSADGSNFRQVPIGVVLPRTVDAAAKTVEVCREHGVPLLSRGGGTSLAGQCTNTAVVIDWSKYCNRLLEVDPANRTCTVEPGIVLDVLNDQLKGHGLRFGPEPATHMNCTIGGMIGNNSCGATAQRTGKVVGNIAALEVLLYDGTRFWCGPATDDQYQTIERRGDQRARIYRRLRELRDTYAEQITERYPDIPRRVSGYNLDSLLPEHGFDIAGLLVDSESTLAELLTEHTPGYTPPALRRPVLTQVHCHQHAVLGWGRRREAAESGRGPGRAPRDRLLRLRRQLRFPGRSRRRERGLRRARPAAAAAEGRAGRGRPRRRVQLPHPDPRARQRRPGSHAPCRAPGDGRRSRLRPPRTSRGPSPGPAPPRCQDRRADSRRCPRGRHRSRGRLDPQARHAPCYRALMAIRLSESTLRLLDGKNYAVLATVNPDGSPQTSVMWVGRDGGDLLFSTVEGRRKHRNMVRDPRVSVTIIDSADPENYVELRGRVTMTPDVDRAVDTQLSWKYDGKDPGEDRPGAVRVVARMTIDKAAGYAA
jgi:PPOX class probable F420-dependent enzyme